MSKSPDDDYVCTLDAKTAQKAREELGEIAEDRLSAVQALREWIEQQKHITFQNTGTLVMLKFLRHAKFSQLRARELVENNLRLKIQAPKWFANVDVKDPNIMALIDAGYMMPLPKRHPDGSLIVLQKIGGLNPSLIHLDAVCRAACVMTHYLAREEENQVNGVKFFMDCTNVSHKVALKFLKPEYAKWNKMWQKNVPGRFKGFCYYNAGTIIEIGIAFFKTCLSKKHFERLHICDTAETLYTKIPKECLPVEYLPDEYDGPTVGDTATILKEFKKTIYSTEFREDLLYYTGKSFSVAEGQTTTDGTAQHYRKLNVD